MRNFRIFLLLAFVTMLLVGDVTNLSAQRQNDLFIYKKRNEIGFASSQIPMLNRMVSNPLYKGHYYVQLRELPTISTDGTITINLPTSSTRFINTSSNDIDGDGVLNLSDGDAYDSCTPSTSNTNCINLQPIAQTLYTFTPVKIETKSPTEYTYYGEWNPCDENNTGYITIIAKDGDIYGQVNINEKVYEIHDLGGRKNILVEWDNNKFPENDCSTDQLNTFDDRPDENLGELRSGGCNVRVLVVFTAAAAAIRNPITTANLFMTQTNTIVSNSKAMTSFTLVGTLPLTGFVEGATMAATLPAFSAFPLTTTLRNTNLADLVVLLADVNDPASAGRAFTTLAPGSGFSVVEIDAGGGRFTFSHEVAHNFACFHDDASGVNARGKSFHNGCLGLGKKSRTVLATLLGVDEQKGESRIMHYSNPDVSFKCRATGNSDRNNAGQISSSSCTVAGYRADPPPPLAVEINGPETGIPGQSYTYCASITSCPKVLSIQWEYSFNGFHYIPGPAGNLTCITLTMPLHGSIYVRVRVICQGGGDVVAFWETYNEKENPKFKGCGWGESAAIQPNSTTQSDFTFAPNPTNGELNIEFDVTTSSKIRFAIFDKLGIERKLLIDQQFESGSHKLSFNISDFMSSNYYIQKLEKGKIVTKQIVKL